MQTGPTDPGLAQTFRFVRAHVPRASSRILEIGSGNGALALLLRQAGHEVVALDSSVDAVADAGRRGIDTRLCRWPDYDDDPFDIIVFTRSLHHMHSLTDSLAQARRLLLPGGNVLADDFAFADVQAADANWFYTTLVNLRNQGVRFEAESGFAHYVLHHGGSLDAWRTDGDHGIHSATAMEQALRAQIGLTGYSCVPYMFRYIAAAVGGSLHSRSIVNSVFHDELQAGSRRQISLIGRHFSAVKGSGATG
jgi:SAM-dependent methyltransferase